MQVKKQQLEPDMEQHWFKIWKGVHQSYLLSSCLFKLYRVHHTKCQAGWITSWNQDCWETYQQPQIFRWCHSNGRKWRGTKGPLDDGERGKWKSWLKTQHSKTKIMISSPITSWWIELGNDGNSVSESCWVMSDSLSSPWNFPVKNTGVGSLSLLQPTQGSNYGLLYCKLPAEPQGKPKNSGVVSLSFSRGSSGHRNRAGSPALQVDFFTNCAIREAWKQREILVLEAPESLQPWN